MGELMRLDGESISSVFALRRLMAELDRAHRARPASRDALCREGHAAPSGCHACSAVTPQGRGDAPPGIQLDPNAFSTRLTLAKTCDARGDRDEARRVRDRALQIARAQGRADKIAEAQATLPSCTRPADAGDARWPRRSPPRRARQLSNRASPVSSTCWSSAAASPAPAWHATPRCAASASRSSSATTSRGHEQPQLEADPRRRPLPPAGRRSACVRESAAERDVLGGIAPHLARPAGWSCRPTAGGMHAKLAVGSGRSTSSRHSATSATRRGTRDETLARAAARRQPLHGAVVFTEYLTDDARLVLDTVRGAHEAGAVVANHVEATAMTRARGTST
jgi:hypothetical protein